MNWKKFIPTAAKKLNIYNRTSLFYDKINKEGNYKDQIASSFRS